jgi:hypothetical protein
VGLPAHRDHIDAPTNQLGEYPPVRVEVGLLPPTLAGLRDRALLLVGFFAALRRSEIVGLDVTGRLTGGATGSLEI